MRLSVDPSDDIDKIDAEFFTGTVIASSEWAALAEALAQGAKTDREQGCRFSSLASLSGWERVEMYLDIFCTATRSARKSIVTKAIGDMAMVERMCAEQQRVCALLERRRAIVCRDRSAALLIVAYSVLERYQSEKERRGLLDYDDLIDKALELLTSVDAAWVHYKLDLGIDHVLVDEAQDTSTKQWQIVRLLTGEFTAGAGARDVNRTIFAVGDEKQSIYSFQNAAPKEFAQMLRYFKDAHTNAGLGFVVSKFEHSFRSGGNVLAAVDEVFKRKEIAQSVTSDQDGFPPHIALPNAPPSVVEIWEPLKPDDRREIEGWDAPFDTVSETSPRVKLARRIARTVRGLVDDGAARYGDILILVRQRGELFEAIIRALKNAARRRRRRRPPRAHRAHCRHGPDGARRRPAVAGGRPCARHRAAQPVVRLRGRRFVCDRMAARPLAVARGARAQGARSPNIRRCCGAPRRTRAGRAARDAVFILCLAARPTAAPGGVSWRGSAWRRTTRSTNSSISPSTTSGARRLRCRGF